VHIDLRQQTLDCSVLMRDAVAEISKLLSKLLQVNTHHAVQAAADCNLCQQMLAGHSQDKAGSIGLSTGPAQWPSAVTA
jgi:hypothetical protein